MIGFLGILFLIILIPALAAGVAVAVYYLIYTARINRKIRSGDVSEKKMAGIPIILRIAGITAAVLICAALALYVWFWATNRTWVVDQYGRCSIERTETVDVEEQTNEYRRENNYYLCCVSGKDGPESIGGYGDERFSNLSYAALFSAKENEGYRKIVKTDGKFSFTVFLNENADDDSEPDFLCFVDYTGEIQPGTDVHIIPEFVDALKENGITDDETEFYTVFSYHVEPSNFARFLCLGCLEEGCNFRLRIRFLTMGEESEITISTDA